MKWIKTWSRIDPGKVYLVIQRSGANPFLSGPQILHAFMTYLEIHRMTCPVPEAECPEALDMLAWLAHCAGVQVGDVAEFRQYLQEYKDYCPNCAHERN